MNCVASKPRQPSTLWLMVERADQYLLNTKFIEDNVGAKASYNLQTITFAASSTRKPLLFLTPPPSPPLSRCVNVEAPSLPHRSPVVSLNNTNIKDHTNLKDSA